MESEDTSCVTEEPHETAVPAAVECTTSDILSHANAPPEALQDEKISQESTAMAEGEGENASLVDNAIENLQDGNITDSLEKDVISTKPVSSAADIIDIFSENAESSAMEVNTADNESTSDNDKANNEATVFETEAETTFDESEAEVTISSNYYFWKYEISPECSPICMITTKNEEFQKSEKNKKAAKYMKGCKWAPDGSCLLSSSDDDNLRLFNFPSSFSTIQDWSSEDFALDTEDWTSVLQVKEGGLIYDYCWYPMMSSMDPVSACLISTSSEAPIHLWDAFTGKLRASYQPFNHLEQLVSAYSLAFDPTGETIYSGYEKCIRLFNITRPGKDCVLRPLKQPEAELNQFGIIASICVNPTLRSFYAVGSFDKTVGLYYEDGSVICLLQGHIGGVTHMKFSSDGMKLFTGGRNDSRLICWDMRKMGEAYKILDRVVTTHQRVYFDVTPNDRYIITGGTDGVVKIWDDLSEGTEPCCTFTSNTDCVNGISCNPYSPLLATSSGQRHFYELAEDSDDDSLFVKPKSSKERCCDIKLWKLT